jgi:hypothetical protein
VSCTAVALQVSVKFTEGTTAPEESLTVPEIDPTAWPIADKPEIAKSTKRSVLVISIHPVSLWSTRNLVENYGCPVRRLILSFVLIVRPLQRKKYSQIL